MSSTAIKKIRGWIKAVVAKLAQPFRREPTPHVNRTLDMELGRKIQQRQAKGVGRPINTRQGGPNMPRRQPCPSCHKRAKRKRKTMGGAYYECKEHGEFSVRALGIIERRD